MIHGKFILRKEWFGGIRVDTAAERTEFLDAAGYVRAKADLLERQKAGANVTLVDVTERGFPIRDDALSSPLGFFCEFTRRCNLACGHCYAMAYNRADAPELPLDVIADLLRRLSDVGCCRVRLTGGEPTRHPDFLRILDLVLEHGMIPAINTNGLFDERMLAALLERGVKDLRVSMDGPREINDAIRGRGTYDKARLTLRRLADARRSGAAVDPTINMVLMRCNRASVGEMIGLAAALGIRISFGLLRPAGRARLEEMLAPEEIVETARTVQGLRKRLGLARGQVRMNFDVFCDDPPDAVSRPYPLDDSKCPIGTQSICVDAFGRIVPCGYLGAQEDPRWLGEDLPGRDILAVWHDSPMLNELRSIRRAGCAGCRHHVQKCNGGCPATAYAITGELDGHDPYCVRNVDEEALR